MLGYPETSPKLEVYRGCVRSLSKISFIESLGCKLLLSLKGSSYSSYYNYAWLSVRILLTRFTYESLSDFLLYASMRDAQYVKRYIKEIVVRKPTIESTGQRLIQKQIKKNSELSNISKIPQITKLKWWKQSIKDSPNTQRITNDCFADKSSSFRLLIRFSLFLLIILMLKLAHQIEIIEKMRRQRHLHEVPTTLRAKGLTP